MFNQQQIYLFCQIQTSQTGGQPDSDTSPYEVSECSLHETNRDMRSEIRLRLGVVFWRKFSVRELCCVDSDVGVGVGVAVLKRRGQRRFLVDAVGRCVVGVDAGRNGCVNDHLQRLLADVGIIDHIWSLDRCSVKGQCWSQRCCGHDLSQEKIVDQCNERSQISRA